VHLYSGGSNTYLVRVSLEPVVDPCTYADPFEDNDSAAQASALAVPALGQAIEHLALTVCGADVDWYRVDAPAGARLELRIQFDHYAGNLQLAAYIDPAGATVATSTTADDEELIIVQPVADTGYFFKVYGQSGASNTYGLRLSQGAPECLGDDPFEPNDTTQQAVNMPLPSPGPDVYAGLVSCLDNEDWYAFPLQAGDSFRVDLAFTSSQGDIEMYLFGPNGSSLDSSTSGSDAESVEVVDSGAGLHKVKVYHWSSDDDATNPYQMTVTYFPGGVDPTCQDDPLEPNDSAAAAAPVGLSLADAAVCGGDQDWYAIPVAAGEYVRVLLDYTPAGSHHLAIALLGPDGASVLDQDTGSAGHPNLEVAGRAQADGRFYLRAELQTPAPSDRAPYQFLVARSSFDCLDGGREPNNSAVAAAPLPLGDYTGLAVCRAAPNDQDWYHLSVGAWGRLHVAADSNPADGDLGLTVYRDDGVTLVGASDQAGAREQVNGPRVAGETTYLVRVLNRAVPNAADLAYRLAAWADPPPDCQDDALEEDDVAQEANLLGAGALDGVLCHVDPDWFALEVPARFRLRAAASYDPAAAALELRAYEADGTTLIAASTTHSGTEVIDRRLAASSTVLLQLAMYQPTDLKRLPYALDVVLESPQECVDDALEPNNDLASASPLVAPGTGDLVLCPADADVHALTVTRGTRASFSLVNTGGLGDADLYLLDAQGATLRSSTLAGAVTDSIANVDSLYDQTYYLRVVPKDLLADDIVDYRLEVVLDTFVPCDDDAFEPNDSAATASALDGERWQPVLDQWVLDLSGLYACRAGAANPPDWYSFWLAAGTHLSVSVSFPVARNADVYLYGPDGTTLLDSSAASANPEVVDFGAFGAPADGVYYLKVLAKDQVNNSFAYAMSLVSDRAFICRAEPFDPFEPNASPAEAVAGGHLTAGAYPALNLCGAEDDYYAVDALAGQTLTATATFAPATDIDLYLLDADGLTLLDASEGVTGTEQVTATLTQDGPVFLLLYFNKHHPDWVAPYDLNLDIVGP
ncbi:MAG TPA: PPC domain-containing protein, partial [Myxococcota bacterium]|nr:PPC domain-containing protein [Myxococcota bacterium]